MTSRDEFLKMINEEAEAWQPSDDVRADELEGLLLDSLLKVPMHVSEADMLEPSPTVAAESPDMGVLAARLFGQTLRNQREQHNLTTDDVAQEIGSDALTVERIEAGRSNPSIMRPASMARWLGVVSVPLSVVRATLLLALQIVNRPRVEPGVSFARAARQTDADTAVSRTDAYEYVDRVSISIGRAQD